MTLWIWDASDFDWSRGGMDYVAAARAGIAVATHKATEGTGTRHTHYGEALNRARAAGIEFLGAYHVVRSVDIAAQIRFFLGYLDAQTPWWRTWPGFFLQVDLEKWSYDPVSASTGIAFAKALQATQSKTVITYASKGQYGDSLRGISTPLWNANYPTWSTSLGRSAPASHRDGYTRCGGDTGPGWSAYSGQTPVFWQYTDNATIGTQPGCDANAYRGTVEQLRQLITGKDADMLDDERKALFAIRDMLGWVDGRVEGLAGLQKPSSGPTKGADLPAVQTIRALSGDLKGLGDTVSTLRAELTALAATVAKLSQPVVNVDAAALAGLPKPPTAAEIATELAKRIGNG